VKRFLILTAVVIALVAGGGVGTLAFIHLAISKQPSTVLLRGLLTWQASGNLSKAPFCSAPVYGGYKLPGPSVAGPDGTVLGAGKVEQRLATQSSDKKTCGYAWTATVAVEPVYTVSFRGNSITIDRSDVGRSLDFPIAGT